MYVGRVEKLLAHYSQIPLCFVNLNGKITRASSKIAEVFKYDGIICTWTAMTNRLRS